MKPGNGLRPVNKVGVCVCVCVCVCVYIYERVCERVKVGKRSQEFSVILPAQFSAYRQPLASCLTWQLCECECECACA